MRLDTPLKIEREAISIKLAWEIDEGTEVRLGAFGNLYSRVLKEIARKDCIDPCSLARAALKAEGYEADKHE